MALNYIALIPAYEPDGNLAEVVSGLKQKDFDIIIVDDGSGPEYEDVFAEAEETATVLSHDKNRGKGAAVKTGLAYINRYKLCAEIQPEEIVVVTIDADGQHLATDALHIARVAGSRPGTLILGSREMEENVPLRSRFGNSVTRKVFKAVSGTEVHDTQTGLRAFTADMIPELMSVKGDRYEYEINVLLELTARETEIGEVPTKTVYIDGNRSSHFETIKDSYRIYREIARFAFSGRGNGLKKLLQMLLFSASSFASFLIDYALYAVLLISGSGLLFANIGARAVSSAVNFAINRSLVFQSKSRITGSAVQYFALAAIILAGNTFVLRTLVSAGIGSMIAKIITEAVFFVISWTVQRYVIFHRSEDESQQVTCSDEEKEGRAFTLEYKAAKPKKLKDAYRRKAEGASR